MNLSHIQNLAIRVCRNFQELKLWSFKNITVSLKARQNREMIKNVALLFVYILSDEHVWTA